MPSGDIKVISSALDLFTKAIATKTAGGGLNVYKFMLELVAGQMAEDRGYDSAIKRLQLVVKEILRAGELPILKPQTNIQLKDKNAVIVVITDKDPSDS